MATKTKKSWHKCRKCKKMCRSKKCTHHRTQRGGCGTCVGGQAGGKGRQAGGKKRQAGGDVGIVSNVSSMSSTATNMFTNMARAFSGQMPIQSPSF